jgi:hypothetical protein
MRVGQRYYRVTDDVYFPGRWHLWEPRDGNGAELWGWEFMGAKPVSVRTPITVSVMKPGVALDFTEVLAIPIVTPKLAGAVADVVGTSCVERFEAEVEGNTARFEVLNVLTALSCADEKRSEILYPTASDDRPDMAGQYKMVSRLVLDQTQLGDADLFRLAEYKVMLICSELLKDRLEKGGFKGLRFEEIAVA